MRNPLFPQKLTVHFGKSPLSTNKSKSKDPTQIDIKDPPTPPSTWGHLRRNAPPLGWEKGSGLVVQEVVGLGVVHEDPTVRYLQPRLRNQKSAGPRAPGPGPLELRGGSLGPGTER